MAGSGLSASDDLTVEPGFHLGLARRVALSDRVGYQIGMVQKIIAAAAWACLVFIAYATLSSAGARPELTRTEPALIVFIERFGAYGLLGFLFCVAYPRRLLFICCIVLGSAVFLELLQLVIPGRDARVIDATEKLLGGVAGILAVRALSAFADRLGWKIT